MSLKVENLGVSYGKHVALEGAGLTVAPGEIVVILGANGAGKSSLLKALSGISEGAVTGSVSLAGHNVHGLPADQIVEEGIALVPEGRGIFGDLTVDENLKLGAYPRRAAGDEAANLDRVFTLFPKLFERRRQVARTMSGGEQQMVAIGRAMMSSPVILTLDEPSLGLSPLLCKELFQNLRSIKDLGIGVLMVEQNAKQSLAIADRGYLLENTRIVHEDRAEALMHDPAVQAAYLGGGGAATAAAAPRVAPASDPAGPDLPNRLTPSRSHAARVGADALAGEPLSALVARASERAAPVPQPVSNWPPSNWPVSDRPVSELPVSGRLDARAPWQSRQGDLQALIQEFEIAAARAGEKRALPRAHSDAKRDPPPDPTAPPVTIEIYRAPRVEIYRRRPNGAFERD